MNAHGVCTSYHLAQVSAASRCFSASRVAFSASDILLFTMPAVKKESKKEAKLREQREDAAFTFLSSSSQNDMDYITQTLTAQPHLAPHVASVLRDGTLMKMASGSFGTARTSTTFHHARTQCTHTTAHI